jgi:ferredoxin--NADP+ reductase
VVVPEDVEFDEASLAELRRSKQTQMVVKTLQGWALRDRRDEPRRLHLHFLRRPVEVLGADRVTGLRTERMELAGDGSVRGTGEITDFPVQPVYRAVGYQGAIEELLVGRGVEYTTWDGWLTLDKIERQLGVERGRERLKVVPREEMVELSRS